MCVTYWYLFNGCCITCDKWRLYILSDACHSRTIKSHHTPAQNQKQSVLTLHIQVINIRTSYPTNHILESSSTALIIVHKLLRRASTMAANIVTSIPLEIAQAILSSCSDSQTLRGLLLSCTFFFNAYSSAKRHILLQVLQNLVKPELLQAVLLTLESPQYIGSEDLFERYHHIIVPVPQSLQLVDLHSIGRLMKSVECLTELLISREFICNPRSNQPFNPPLTLSEEEKDRIKRNLLWYQTYCTVGAGIGNDGAAAMKTRRFFHKYFATWETEQLFTVAFWLDRLLIDGKLHSGSSRKTLTSLQLAERKQTRLLGQEFFTPTSRKSRILPSWKIQKTGING